MEPLRILGKLIGINVYPKQDLFDEKINRGKAQKIISVLRDFYGEEALKNSMVLDVGCAGGIVTKELSNYVERIIGIDIDENSIKIANRDNSGKNITFLVADATSLPIEDESIDIVIGNHIYPYIQKQKKFIKEIKRVLKANGFCYFAGVNIRSSWFTNECHKTLNYWSLQKLVRDFEFVDYTVKILKNPEKYHATDIIGKNCILRFIPEAILNRLIFLAPSWVWILVNKSE